MKTICADSVASLKEAKPQASCHAFVRSAILSVSLLGTLDEPRLSIISRRRRLPPNSSNKARSLRLQNSVVDAK